MQVQHLRRAGPLVQVVHVLGDDTYAPAGHLLKLGQGQVPGIRGHGAGLGAALVIEVQHQGRVAGKAFGRGHVLDAVLLPQPIGVAEGADAAFGRYAGAGKYYKVGHGSIYESSANSQSAN